MCFSYILPSSSRETSPPFTNCRHKSSIDEGGSGRLRSDKRDEEEEDHPSHLLHPPHSNHKQHLHSVVGRIKWSIEITAIIIRWIAAASRPSLDNINPPCFIFLCRISKPHHHHRPHSGPTSSLLSEESLEWIEAVLTVVVGP